MSQQIDSYIDNRSTEKSIFNLFKGTVGAGKQRLKTARTLKVFLQQEVKPFLTSKVDIFRAETSFTKLKKNMSDASAANNELLENNISASYDYAKKLEKASPDTTLVKSRLAALNTVGEKRDEILGKMDITKDAKLFLDLPMNVNSIYEGLEKNFGNAFLMYSAANKFISEYLKLPKNEKDHLVKNPQSILKGPSSAEQLELAYNKAIWYEENIKPFYDFYGKCLEMDGNGTLNDNNIREECSGLAAALMKGTKNSAGLTVGHSSEVAHKDLAASVEKNIKVDTVNISGSAVLQSILNDDDELPELIKPIQMEGREIVQISGEDDAFSYFANYGVATNAKFADYRKVYNKLAFKLHPDKNKAPHSLQISFNIKAGPEVLILRYFTCL